MKHCYAINNLKASDEGYEILTAPFSFEGVRMALDEHDDVQRVVTNAEG